MLCKLKILSGLFILLFANPAFANNLVISNVTLEDRNASAKTMVVQFNISWDHSWRKADGRHDAAWVFIKIYQNSTAPWIHGKLYTAGTNPVDTSPGTNSDVKIVIPTDKIGAFISRNATGNGTFSSKKVRLNVDYGTMGIANTDTVQVKVYGIEMVYIPEGPFYIGDGDGSQESTDAFHLNGVDNTAVQITTTGKSITVDSNIFDDIDTSPVTVTGLAGITGNTSWPNGYSAFYLMKYELSQVQFVDFLNTLSRVQQGKRMDATVSGDTIANYYVMRDTTSVNYRQNIRAPASGNGTSPTTVIFGNDSNNNGTFNESDDGAVVPMNYVLWSDLAAYADWAGLRPYTELEYEKACRGPLSAVYLEYAWGTTQRTASVIADAGRNTEYSSVAGEGLSSLLASANLRVGFAATNATNRKSAGAGYYGNMNLGDNMAEMVGTLGNSAGRAFTGSHGDGTLTTTASYEGNATNNDWPGIDGTTSRGVTGTTGAIQRGGNITSTSPLADRGNIVLGLPTTRPFAYYFGVRLARTAP